MIVLVRRIVVISVVVPALLACGAVVALAAPGAASTPITEPQAVAFAQAVNLQPGDLPGYQSRSRPKESDHTLGCGQAHFRPVATEGSSDFVSRANLVASGVAVMPSEALAKAVVATINSRGGRRCIARETKENLGPETSRENVTFVPLTRKLGAGAIAFHAVGAGKRPLHEDAVFFRAGPALIVLITFGERDLPAATEGRLLALLHSRAEAQKL